MVQHDTSVQYITAVRCAGGGGATHKFYRILYICIRYNSKSPKDHCASGFIPLHATHQEIFFNSDWLNHCQRKKC